MTVGSTLSLRLAAILLVGFIALQLLVAIIALPSSGDARRPYNLPRPEEAAAIVNALDRTPVSQREMVVQALNGGLYSIALTAAQPTSRAHSSDLVELERQYELAIPGRRVAVDGRRPRFGHLIGPAARPARFFAPIRVAIDLSGGGVLLFTSRPSDSAQAYLRSRAVIGALGGLALLLALVLAVRQTTRPLSRLAHGIRRFAGDLETPDLPVTGPREVRELAGTFNDMKAEIRELVSERTRVLAAIAHDLRTYLTRLRLRAEFIDDPDQQSRAVRDLGEMTALINDTLLLADRDTPRASCPEHLAIAPALAEIVDAHVELGERVSLSPIAGDFVVAATPLSFRRILDNLIANGVRHGSSVTISVQPGGDKVGIIVEDDGPGVPAEALARLGSPFQRFDPSRSRETGGAGLGLAIVKALAGRDHADVIFSQRFPTGLRVAILYSRIDA